MFFCIKWSKFGNSDLIYSFRAPSEKCCCVALFFWFPKNTSTKHDPKWSDTVFLRNLSFAWKWDTFELIFFIYTELHFYLLWIYSFPLSLHYEPAARHAFSLISLALRQNTWIYTYLAHTWCWKCPPLLSTPCWHHLMKLLLTLKSSSAMIDSIILIMLSLSSFLVSELPA